MQQKFKQMLTALINIYHQGPLDTFLVGMSPEEIEDIALHNTSASSVADAIIKPSFVFSEKIHYSWLVAEVKTFKPSLQKPLVAALPPAAATGLSALLNIDLTGHLNPKVGKYLLKLLCEQMSLSSITPLAFLPSEPLSYLGSYSKTQLIEIIDFLGLYDLAEEIKTIVDKMLLKSVYQGLAPKQHKFLRTCLHQRQRFSSAKLGLANWKRDPQQLQRLLHRRGLMRLGYALSGHHRDLIWHITRRLDTGRGQILEKNYAPKEIPNVTQPLQQQVQAIINFLKKQDSP